MKTLFGGSESSTQVDPAIRKLFEDNFARAQDVAKIGYMPYSGPQVAAMPKGILDIVNRNAEAMGSGGVENIMPEPTDFGGGLLGYSGKGLFDQAVADFEKERPGQAAAYNSLFVDPFNAEPAAPEAPTGPQEAWPGQTAGSLAWANNPQQDAQGRYLTPLGPVDEYTFKRLQIAARGGQDLREAR